MITVGIELSCPYFLMLPDAAASCKTILTQAAYVQVYYCPLSS